MKQLNEAESRAQVALLLERLDDLIAEGNSVRHESRKETVDCVETLPRPGHSRHHLG